MSEQTQPAETPKKSVGGQLMVDLGPIAVFVVAYNIANRTAPAGQAIYWATGLFMVATVIALIYARVVQKRVPPMLIFTAIVLMAFGGLTIALKDPIFIKIKPTVVNLFYAAVIFGGLLFKRNIWRQMFEGGFTLPERIWRVLAVRWGIFFLFMAALNEFVWRNFSEAFWANFKLIGGMGLVFLFGLLNVPITLKYSGRTDETPPVPPPPE
jgi:intracellular septation protein